MSKHNYSQYSNKKNYNNKFDTTPEGTVDNQNGDVTAVTEEVETVVETTVETVVNTTVDTTVETETTTETETNSGAVGKGVVANCAKLNVRSKPSVNGDVICVLDKDVEVTIDVDESTDEWFKIRTVTGGEGYCMRKFVNANI